MEEVETKKGKFKIPVKLNVQDRAEMADKLSVLEIEKNAAVGEFSGHRKLYSIRMSEIKEKAETILAAISTGVSEKEMNCERTFFFAKGIVRFTDPKSRTVLFERPMTAEEREPELFHPDPEKEKCSTKPCIKCGEKWFGGDNKQICHNCKKLDEYRFGKDV
jgi:hypothetical protein